MQDTEQKVVRYIDEICDNIGIGESRNARVMHILDVKMYLINKYHDIICFEELIGL